LSNFTVYLLRHGELVQSGILCGHCDIELSLAGQQQLLKVGKTLPQLSRCISSPLQRCARFARQYCHQHKVELTLNADIKEMNFGDWDGRAYQQLWQPSDTNTSEMQTGNNLGDFWQNPWQNQIPNGEPMADFVARVDNFWDMLLGDAPTGNTLIVSHGGVIRHILARVLGLPVPGVKHMSQIDVPYGALIKINVSLDDDGIAWPRLAL
jgi:alpha-ribazole phosphatase